MLCGYQGVTSSRLPLLGNKSCLACAILKWQNVLLFLRLSVVFVFFWNVVGTGCGQLSTGTAAPDTHLQFIFPADKQALIDSAASGFFPV